MKKAFEISAGAVIFFQNQKQGQRQYLLLFRKGHDGFKDYYGFVQGNIEKGEKPEATVLREAREETGLEIELIPGFKHQISYFYTREGSTISKKVIFFVARAKTTEVKISKEHDAYFWLSFDEAMQRLKFKNQKELLKKVEEFLNKAEQEKQ
jgi:8-oxo-dGTP pyrophosphatase MutT (NUDIX family)